ncbi:molybdate ABC transporter, inner membrane subunit [Planktothrix agardhii CCAP 1459/11A]|uniref:Molybdate ABC transporter, inner membrane subunit n=1 Tax=Planktothrix agardhii CCAP 1459/11A TaxID=282420 RepID=A0A4P5ZY04_PLAAG|nr:molybdate ABC transporter permease subunit [Planktothrix agardhii]GDZ94975.1 molybdate ABC transporter, inner membrane subunit [Planktothrix agardhii CCAP 1459/11A]
MTTDLSPLWISLKTAGLATIATFFLGTAAAYGMLGYRGRWKSLMEGLLIAPLILPPTVVGFLLLLLFGKNGFLGQFLSWGNFSIVFTWYAAVITATVVSFPLMYKTTLGAFEQIDSSLLQVARTLGASEVRVLLQILLPLATPGLVAGITLSFARALGEFGATLMLAGNIPGQTQTMPMAIYFAVEAGDFQEAWLWTIAIMSLSLSGLMTVNFTAAKGGKLTNSQAKNNKQLITGREVPWRVSTLITDNHCLLVDIEKQLANFKLKVAFTSGQETLGILGGSGSGKSMTLRCLAGVETPTRGRIVLNGRTLFDADQQINLPCHQRRVSLVFQNYALFPHLTIAQNIAFGLDHLPKLLRQQQVTQQLTIMELEGLGDRFPHQISGGQQQRVALARALAIEPELLLLDEPFSALDTHLRSQMEQQLLATLTSYRGITLFVTHNLEEAYRLCANLMVMSGGLAIASGTKHQIFEHPQTVRVAQLTGCKNFSRAVIQGANSVTATDWDVTLQVLEAIPNSLTNIGIRAHQIKITTNSDFPDTVGDNTYPCWLAATSETPHHTTLFLKFNATPASSQDYHVQAEVFKEKWNAIKDQPFPWYVCLDPARLMLLTFGNN